MQQHNTDPDPLILRSLIDWTLKWEEVRPFVLATIFLVVSASAKFIFKSQRWMFAHIPESCLLITIGSLFGGLFKFGK